MDPCECMWYQEMAMRRLLSLLRESQSSCTDTECYSDVPPNPLGEITRESGNMMLMTICCLVVAFVLFISRPKSLRGRALDSKPPSDRSDGDQAGPDSQGTF